MSFDPPEFGAPCAPHLKSDETLRLLATRRSTQAALLAEPGPDGDAVDLMLQIAARVPDHRRVYPFRFVVVEGEGRARIGAAVAAAFAAKNPDAEEKKIDAERARLARAPVVVAVVAATQPEHKTPEWEQVLSVGAVCQNLLIAASASGFAAQWLTEWYAYDPAVLEAMGVRPGERVAGFVYIGSASEPPKERPRPDWRSLTTRIGG
ncbi:MAG: nitroreductase [Pseudomonadota bacterium]